MSCSSSSSWPSHNLQQKSLKNQSLDSQNKKKNGMNESDYCLDDDPYLDNPDFDDL